MHPAKLYPLYCACGKKHTGESLPSLQSDRLCCDGRVGTMLTKLIPKFFESSDCDCKSYARKMDRWGIAKCEERFDEIVDHLVKQSATKPILKQFPTFVRLVAAQWLRMAINHARKAIDTVDINHFILCDTPRDDCEIVTFHFNPIGYHRLRETYYEWLPSIAAISPKCYEVAFDDDTPEIDGSILIRGTRAKHLLWQKEAVMNIALANTQAKYFAWIDHDLVFTDPHWLAKAIELLDAGHVAVQLFSKVVRLALDKTIVAERASAMATGSGSPGGAWIASTQFLRDIGGFETSNLFGGGDQSFYDVILGKPGNHLRQYSDKMASHIAAWVERAAKIKGSRTASFVDQTAYHLWHGDIKDRQYATRYKVLAQSDFDPVRDIRTASNGLLEWCSEKPVLHEALRAFFAGRKEDG